MPLVRIAVPANRDARVVLSENDAIDWSFGAGIAQYAPAD